MKYFVCRPSVVMWSAGNEPRSYRSENVLKPIIFLNISEYSEYLKLFIVLKKYITNNLKNRNRSGSYFAKVADLTRSLDSTRPVSSLLKLHCIACNNQNDIKWIIKRAKRPELKVTLVTNVGWDQDLASQHFDIIAINRYFGWYSDPGYVNRLLTLSKIRFQVVEDLIIEIKYFDTNYNPEIICYPIDKYGRERPKIFTFFSF